VEAVIVPEEQLEGDMLELTVFVSENVTVWVNVRVVTALPDSTAEAVEVKVSNDVTVG